MDWFQTVRFFLAAVLVLIVPGAAVLAWLPGDSSRPLSARHDPIAWLTDAAALSIAITALVALWLFVAGIRLGGVAVAGLYGVCVLALLAALISCGIRWPGSRGWVSGLLALLFIGVLIVWRFYQSQSLALPAWVDSVQHVLIVRKFGEYGGIPPDLSPYMAIPFFYHFGFHLIAALFAFVAGASPEQAVLWFGQVINALVSVSVYRAALAFQDRPVDSLASARPVIPAFLAAGAAALLVEFSFQMPAYYLTWGRYTLLTGLILLGPTLAAAMEVWRCPACRSAWVCLGVLVGGLCLIHYFALLLAGLFMLVLGVFWGINGLVRLRLRHREYWHPILSLGLVALAGVLLALPWVIRAYDYNRQVAEVQLVSPIDQTEAAQKGTASYLQYLIYLVGPKRNQILLGIAGAGLLLGLRRSNLRVLTVWGLLLGLLSLPWGLRFGPFRPDHFAIVLFFPAAILLAELLADGAAVLGRLLNIWAGRVVLALVVGLIAFWGARETRNVLNSATVFADKADVAALDWVNKHTSPAARFYINSTPWQGNVYRGVDGGYWLIPYTGRGSLVPPIPYGWGTKDEITQINQWAERSDKLKGCTPDFWSIVREAGLTYVYIRQGRGSLQPAALNECPRLKPVYQQSGVFIYEILPPG